MRRGLLYFAVLLFSAILFFWGSAWGLPTRASDAFLFGDRTPWTGSEILNLLKDSDVGERGADVAASAIDPASLPRVINATDIERARIVRRYRLMSQQPDEFINFKALGEMAGRSGVSKLDPRLYQYGGVWIYPLGVACKLATLVKFIPVPPPGQSAAVFYLDHPEAFGRFYLVGRWISALWGLAAVAAAMTLLRTLGTRPFYIPAVGVMISTLPVMLSGTREAKPHVAGAALALWACVTAIITLKGQRPMRWTILTGVLCGLAMGTVIHMLLIAIVLPTLSVLDKRHGRVKRLLAGLAALALVYAITNPFVPINAITAPHLLQSNVGNSTAMYAITFAGIGNAIGLIFLSLQGGCFMMLLLFSGVILLPRLHKRDRGATLLMVAILPLLLMFFALAAGKPAEYARFALVPVILCITLLLGAIAKQVASDRETRASRSLLGFILLLDLFSAMNFHPARLGTSLQASLCLRSERDIQIGYEPAPWSMPAVDLWNTQLTLHRRDTLLESDGLKLIPANLESQVRGALPMRESISWQNNCWMLYQSGQPGGVDAGLWDARDVNQQIRATRAAASQAAD